MVLFDILQKAQKGYGRALEPICRQWALTRNEMDVLLFLYNNPGLNRAADIVEDRGFLVRQLDPQDRRTDRLRLTEAALPAARQGRAAQLAYFERLFRGMNREEMERFQQLVQKICINIENLEE